MAHQEAIIKVKGNKDSLQKFYLFITNPTAMSIRIFVTGGTFDKEYNELNGELFFKNSNKR